MREYAISSRRCEACGNLYHPSGTFQKHCVRPFCIKARGERLSAYRDPRYRQRGGWLTAEELAGRIEDAESDLAILARRTGLSRQRSKLREKIRAYQRRLEEVR